MPTIDRRVRKSLQLASAILAPLVGLDIVRHALSPPSGVDLSCRDLPGESGGPGGLACRPGTGGKYDRKFETWLELEIDPSSAGWRATLTTGEPIVSNVETDGTGRRVLVIERDSAGGRRLAPFTWGAGAVLALAPVGHLSQPPALVDWKAHLVDAPMDSRDAQHARRRNHWIAVILFGIALLPASFAAVADEREDDATTLTDRLVRRCVDNAVGQVARKQRKVARAMLRDAMFDGAQPEDVVPPRSDGTRDIDLQLTFIGVSGSLIRRLRAVQGEIERRLDQAARAASGIAPAAITPADDGSRGTGGG